MPAASRLTQIRARLQLPVVRRATGLLEGRHWSVYKGHGQDFDDLHQYAPGDDVGDIDWNASARTGTPVVKRYIATSNITLLVVVDTGRHMAATAASGEPKSDVAAFATTVLAHLGQVRGDRVSLMAGDAGRLTRMPARAGQAHLEVLVRTVERAFDPDAPAGDLARLLDQVLRTSRRRSLVAVVTDEARPTEADAQALARVRTRHEVMVIQVADADPFGAELTDGAPGALTGASSARERGRTVASVGRGAARDIETGRSLPAYLRGRRKLREAVGRAREERHAATVARMRALGVDSVVVEGTDDTIDEIVAMLGRLRRAGR
ncbi:MAG: DUF58 domain-containing protein [Actinomycetales bacterium]|nr:DUF58 domain-containing protein [Actinomycetales bacterium]